MPEQSPAPVLIIGKSHRPGRISFGPEVVVETITQHLARMAPGLAEHVEPRHVGRLLRLLFRRSTRVVHFLSTGRWSLLAPVMRFVLGKHVVTTFHGYAPLITVSGPAARLQQMISILQLRAGLAGSQTIVPVSQLVAERSMSLAPRARHTVIRNPIGDRFLHPDDPPRELTRHPAEPLRFLIVGFGRHKGIEGVLGALRAIDRDTKPGAHWSLTIAGLLPGSRGYLSLLRRRFGDWLDRVRFLDALPHEQMPSLYRDHDVLILWSSHEAFGLVVPEAMARGVVPVISDRVGAREMVTDGRNGFIVPYGDSAALTDRLRCLIEGGGAIDMAAMRESAEHVSALAAATQYRDLYRTIVGPGPRVLFATNRCLPYRVRVFAELGRVLPVRYVFFAHQESDAASANDLAASLDAHTMPALGRPALYRALFTVKYDVLVKCINGKVPLALAFLVARLRGRRFVLWTGLWRHPQTLLHRIGRPLVHLLYRHADAVAVYGDHVRRYLCETGVDPGKIVVVPQAVDNAAFSRPVRPSELEVIDRFLGGTPGDVILYVGRLQDQKGISVLLHSCAMMPPGQWTLAFVGDGSGLARYRRLAAGLGLERVYFAGSVHHERLPAWYRRATVLVLPSVATSSFREPWGLVTNEAFNQGCPVIVSDSVGAAAGGMVAHGVNGLVVPEGAPGPLAEALTGMLGNREMRDRLGEAGRRTVQEWTQEKMVEGFLHAIGTR